MGSEAVNPPPCARCGLPVEGVSRSVWRFGYYHGDCYALYAAELWAGIEQRSGIGTYSHDERVTDGLEQP